MAAYFWVFLVLAGFGAFHGLSARARVQATLRARANISAGAVSMDTDRNDSACRLALGPIGQVNA